MDSGIAQGVVCENWGDIWLRVWGGIGLAGFGAEGSGCGARV